WKEAAEAAGKAVELFPEYVDEGSPYLVRARGQRETGAADAATATLLEYRRPRPRRADVARQGARHGQPHGRRDLGARGRAHGRAAPPRGALGARRSAHRGRTSGRGRGRIPGTP